jgi:signal transduction histidine kinase/DNA-binding NarL/FixJ family response regulator
LIIGRASAPGHIVVCHERADRREAVARMLRDAHHRVTVVNGTGDAAIRAIAEAQPDLIVGSVSLKDPPLGTVVRAVRLALRINVPILVLVGSELKGVLVVDNPDCLIDADDMIREPVDPAELALRISSLLGGRFESRRLQKRVRELMGLYRLSWAFSLAGGPETLFGELAHEAAGMFGAAKAALLLFDRDRRELAAQTPGFGLTPEQIARFRYEVDGECCARWHFRKNGPLLSNDVTQDRRLIPEIADLLGLRTLLAAPLLRGRRTHGLILVADRTDGTGFSDDDLTLMQSVAGQAAVAVENLLLHEEIKRANALLQEYDRRKSEFVGIVAHDFRRPLMAIRGFAELVLEEPDLPVETRREYMGTVIVETDQLARLADDTLLITRIETGELSYDWHEIELGPFILEAIPLGLAEHSVLTDIPRDLPPIFADPDRLRRVMTNLLSNAVKYSPEGGAILIRCRQRKGDIVIEVRDHGLGIPKDQIASLFQKFQRVRAEAHLRIGGSGLGLYICRRIVEGHGGRIWVESEPGQGSTFAFSLPRDPRNPSPA